jgi:hypothetical protein
VRRWCDSLVLAVLSAGVGLVFGGSRWLWLVSYRGVGAPGAKPPPQNRGYWVMAGYRITPVLVFWTFLVPHWEFLRLWTGFELPSSWSALPCYGADLNRNSFDFMRWPHIGLGAQDLNDIQRPKSFKKIAGS